MTPHAHGARDVADAGRRRGKASERTRHDHDHDHEHGNWDQGGYCNRLVMRDGCGDWVEAVLVEFENAMHPSKGGLLGAVACQARLALIGRVRAALTAGAADAQTHAEQQAAAVETLDRVRRYLDVAESQALLGDPPRWLTDTRALLGPSVSGADDTDR